MFPINHEDLQPYAASMPPNTWLAVAELLRGNLPDAKLAAHLAHHVAGFALRQWDTHGPVFGGQTREAMAQECERQAASGDFAATAFPWKPLALVLLKIIEELLSR